MLFWLIWIQNRPFSLLSTSSEFEQVFIVRWESIYMSSWLMLIRWFNTIDICLLDINITFVSVSIKICLSVNSLKYFIWLQNTAINTVLIVVTIITTKNTLWYITASRKRMVPMMHCNMKINQISWTIRRLVSSPL